MYVDGSSNAFGISAGLILISPGEIIAKYALCFEFSTINNRAEYEALIVGLRIAKELGVDHVKAYGNFQLVVG